MHNRISKNISRIISDIFLNSIAIQESGEKISSYKIIYMKAQKERKKSKTLSKNVSLPISFNDALSSIHCSFHGDRK